MNCGTSEFDVVFNSRLVISGKYEISIIKAACNGTSLTAGGGGGIGGTYYVSVGRDVPPKGVSFQRGGPIFRVCLGWGYIQFWEGLKCTCLERGCYVTFA